MTWTVILVCVTLGCLLLETEGQELDGPARDVRLVNFNTGLTPLGQGLLSSYLQRRTALLEATRSNPVFTSADVVCLQELLVQEDLLSVRSSLSAAGVGYHYAFYDNNFNSLNNDQPACDPATIGAAFACAATPCLPAILGGDVNIIFICLVSHCNEFYRTLSPSCIPCLSDWRVPTFGNITASIQRCASTSLQRDYIQQHGLSLSSRVPLTNVRYVDFANGTSQIVRGYIQATHPTVGEITCTHQTATSFAALGFQTPDGFSSYGELQDFETASIIAAHGNSPGIALGDQNSSPSLPASGINPYAPSAYEAYVAAGFRSTLILANNASCTFCLSNPLETTTPDILIDNIFVTSHYRDSVISSQVALQANITGQAFPLSDHYATVAVVNTGGAYSVAFSRWVRDFERWNDAFYRWQVAANNGPTCSPPPSM